MCKNICEKHHLWPMPYQKNFCVFMLSHLWIIVKFENHKVGHFLDLNCYTFFLCNLCDIFIIACLISPHPALQCTIVYSLCALGKDFSSHIVCSDFNEILKRAIPWIVTESHHRSVASRKCFYMTAFAEREIYVHKSKLDNKRWKEGKKNEAATGT